MSGCIIALIRSRISERLLNGVLDDVQSLPYGGCVGHCMVNWLMELKQMISGVPLVSRKLMPGTHDVARN